jgi:cell division protease FtsH
LDEALERVRHIVELRRDALVALAEQLIEVESIDSADLKRIIEKASPGPLVVPGTEEKVARPLEIDMSDDTRMERRG